MTAMLAAPANVVLESLEYPIPVAVGIKAEIAVVYQRKAPIEPTIVLCPLTKRGRDEFQLVVIVPLVSRHLMAPFDDRILMLQEIPSCDQMSALGALLV